MPCARFSIALFSLRVNDYLEAKIEHVLVDPDVNFVYTRRKRRLLGLEDALDPKHQNSEYHALPAGLRKAKAFLADEYLHEIQTLEDLIIARSASTVQFQSPRGTT